MKKFFPVMNISRHRMATDSKGISTLVTLYGCSLHCEYCINEYCHYDDTPVKNLSCDKMYKVLKEDDSYFRMSNGGVTFGGGEPLLYADVICDFISNYKPSAWKVAIETSLNIEWDSIECLARVVDYWIIDIKDMNPVIYKLYTGVDNYKVISNLEQLSFIAGKDKIKIRVPNIPEYNIPEGVKKSKEIAMRYADEVEVFNYRVC